MYLHFSEISYGATAVLSLSYIILPININIKHKVAVLHLHTSEARKKKHRMEKYRDLWVKPSHQRHRIDNTALKDK